MGWEDVGSVVAPGIWTAGSIKGTKYCDQAYQLGKLGKTYSHEHFGRVKMTRLAK